MSNKLYKYLGPDIIDRVFANENNATLKCSYPKDFNDPYELFLTIDFNENPEVLAFYAEVIGELPQVPTTCFSRSPSVIPMWAHYANNLRGFVIEIDEEVLSSHFPESGFGDVDYLDTPDDSITDILYHAYHIGKFRHAYLLQKAVFSAAYYTKNSCWSYELERRMVVKEAEIKQHDDLILIEVPNECISAIVCGPRASEQTARSLYDRAESIGCDYYEIKIGRSSSTPFFLDSGGETHVFRSDEIYSSEGYCTTCKEPIEEEQDQCSWCQIDSSHQESASIRNPYRLLAGVGILESYVKGMEETTRRYKKE